MEKFENKSALSLEKKKELLFLTRTLGRAGVGVSLVSVLNNMDYSRYNITLGVQFPIKDLETEIPAGVKIVYYGEITSEAYRSIFNWKNSLKGKSGVIKLVWHLLNRIEELRMHFKVRLCFRRRYDTATAYHQGMASKYVIHDVRANKKIMWYHSSVIEYPWYKQLFRKADLIITDSFKARDTMIEEWGKKEFENKIVGIHPQVPIEEIKQKADEEINYKVEEDQFLIMSCGRLSEEKGMDLAVKAVSILKEKGFKNIKWIIVGDGPEREKLEKMIVEYEVVDNIQLLGFKSNPYPYFKLCSLYVQPSRLEAFGLTMAEAQVLGKPVVTTETNGGKESVENMVSGLVTPISAEAISEAIESILVAPDFYQQLLNNVVSIDFHKQREEAISLINELEG